MPDLIRFRLAGRGKVVLFVHSISSDPEQWRHYSSLLAKDDRLADWDMWSFGFTTHYTGDVPSIQKLADLLYSRTQVSPLSDCRELVLIAHSMGGLVVQRALVDHDDLVAKVTHIFQFATPSWGLNSRFQALRRVFLSQQLLDMEVDSPFIQNLRAQWKAKFDILLPFKMLDVVPEHDEYHPDPRPIPHAVRRDLPGGHRSIIDADSPEHPSIALVTKELSEADPEAHELSQPNLIFMSHSHQDHSLVEPFVAALSAKWPVWWSPELLPGSKWEEKINEALRTCACVTVLWSSASVQSNWVLAEAGEAKRRNKLVPVRIAGVQPPKEFQAIQTLDLIGWAGDAGDAQFQRLEQAIAVLISEHRKA